MGPGDRRLVLTLLSAILGFSDVECTHVRDGCSRVKINKAAIFFGLAALDTGCSRPRNNSSLAEWSRLAVVLRTSYQLMFHWVVEIGPLVTGFRIGTTLQS